MSHPTDRPWNGPERRAGNKACQGAGEHDGYCGLVPPCDKHPRQTSGYHVYQPETRPTTKKDLEEETFKVIES